MALTKVPSNLDSVTATTQSASDNSTNVATTEYVTTAVANLVDGAPSTLNTLNEIAAALNDDAALNTTLTNSIATKLPLAGGTMTGNIAHAGTFTLDVGGNLVFDADGGEIQLKDGGTEFGQFAKSGNDFRINQAIQDGDFVFRGNDGGSIISALTLDMSEAGRATFNEDLIAQGLHVGSRNATYDFYNNGTSYFNGAVTIDDQLTLTSSSARVIIGSGFRVDDNGTTTAGRLGFNRNPADGSYLSSSSYQRYQINGPGSSGDYLDIQNYNSGGTYQGSLRISGANAYLNGSNDMRIKLSDSGIAGAVDSNNTVNIRGDNDGLKLNAAANGYILSEINGVRAMNIASNGRVSVGASALGTAQTEIKVPAGTGGLYVTTSSSGSVFSAFQTLSCVNTLSASNTWHDVAYVSHSPNIRVIGKSYQSNNVVYGGASAEYTLLGHYGSVSTTNNKQYALAMNGGDTTADLEYRYLNSGASSGSYRLQVKMGFSGGTHTVYTSITGMGSADFYEDN